MKDCQGELLSRVRRGLASTQEQTAFEAHLDSCENCRMTLELMSDFDAMGEAEPSDWERVAAMADAAAAAHGRVPAPAFRAPRGAWRIAVAALVLTGVAAAGVAVSLRSRSASHSDAVDVEQPGDVARKAIAQERHVPSEEGTPPVENSTKLPAETSEQIEAAPEAVPHGSLPRSAAPNRSPSATSAKDTYKAANDARRAGRTREAIGGYQKLQRLFPHSPEARASRVSLGGLLLRTGSSSAALAQFDVYLAASGGQLAAEALFGRAQALRALGRSAEEVQNLDRLVKTYPNSAYATHAQRRLLELR